MKTKKSKLKTKKSKLKTQPIEPPKPPKDREVHLGGFSRHKQN
jgi:hypothetical protein